MGNTITPGATYTGIITITSSGLVKFIYFLILSFLLMIMSHYAVDLLQEWYVTPLGPHLIYK